jgi:hypothetical protein
MSAVVRRCPVGDRDEKKQAGSPLRPVTERAANTNHTLNMIESFSSSSRKQPIGMQARMD